MVEESEARREGRWSYQLHCRDERIRQLAHYVAAKHDVVDLMETLASRLGREIRVNTVPPNECRHGMIQNEPRYRLFAPHVDNPTCTDSSARSLP